MMPCSDAASTRQQQTTGRFQHGARGGVPPWWPSRSADCRCPTTRPWPPRAPAPAAGGPAAASRPPRAAAVAAPLPLSCGERCRGLAGPAGRGGAVGGRAHLPVIALDDGRGALGRRVLHPLADRLAIVARLVQRAQLLARDRAGPARGRGRGAALGSGAGAEGRCAARSRRAGRALRVAWGAAAPARRSGRKCPELPPRSDNGSGAARAGARLWARRFSGRSLLVWGNVPAKGAAVVQRRAAGRHRLSAPLSSDQIRAFCFFAAEKLLAPAAGVLFS